MLGVKRQADGDLRADEVRGALDRMAASEAFRGSPQLVAFLRYVVDAALRGTADRIKGYTIAVEALGRPEGFDPQTDPIVRVEAMRLRRALTRYYDNGGKDDPVVIELPLGNYVPSFRRAATPPTRLDRAMTAGARVSGLRQVSPRGIAYAAALVVAGAAVYGGLDFWFGFFNAPSSEASALAEPARASPATPLSTIYPVVYVEAFQPVGDEAPPVANRLRGKLRDALARFDEITIISGAPSEARRPMNVEAGRYGLIASVEAAGTGLVSVAIRLTDIADGRIVFARTFKRTDEEDAASAEEAIVRETAVSIAQPYGVIHARERASLTYSSGGDARYRCLLDTYEFWRSIRDAAQHAAMRDCLENATSADPSFASGFAALAEVTLQEYRLGLAPRPGDAPPLDRALKAARRAVELKPSSAHAHQALMDVLFLRGDYALSLEAGERAVTLNPYHPSVLGCYGARLLALGEIEKGARHLREAASAGAVRPDWLEFYLFLAAYLSNDERRAASHVSQFTSGKFSLGLLARSLFAARKGQIEQARQYFGRLAELQPRWRDDPRREAKRMFPAEAVSGRLTRDLALLGAGFGQ